MKSYGLKFINLSILAVVIFGLCQVSFCENPPKEFMQLRIWNDYAKKGLKDIYLYEFIKAMNVAGNWAKMDDDQWVYKYKVVDVMTDETNKVALLFKRVTTDNNPMAATYGLTNKDVFLPRIFVNGYEDPHNRLFEEIINRILKQRGDKLFYKKRDGSI
jgi:hypothetical protein